MPQSRQLFLVRHAIAAERGDKWPDDAKRPLTHQGAARMRTAAEGLSAIGVRPDVVVTSPLARAEQTADILVKGLGGEARLVTAPALAPGGSPAAVADAVSTLAKGRSIAIVGHEPGLGELAAWLVGARQPLPFKKGGVCRIDVADWPPTARSGTLVWFATPKMLRALA
jgi:phosphohistidine phosphatase